MPQADPGLDPAVVHFVTVAHDYCRLLKSKEMDFELPLPCDDETLNPVASAKSAARAFQQLV